MSKTGLPRADAARTSTRFGVSDFGHRPSTIDHFPGSVAISRLSTSLSSVALAVALLAPRPLLAQAGKGDVAAQAFRALEAAVQQDVETGNVADEVAKQKAVIEQAEAFLKRHGASPLANDARYLLGRAHLALSDRQDPARHLDACRDAAQASLASKPKAELAAKAQMLMVKVYLAAGLFDNAATEAKTLAKSYPKQEEAWSALWAVAQACEVRNRPELAKELYSNLTTNFPKCDVADTAKGSLRRLGMLGKEFGPLKFTALDGKEVDVAKLRGKVVAVYFWATWCRNCLRDAPLIHQAYDHYKRLGFEIIGISLDRDKDTLQKFLTEHEIPWPQYFDGKGWNSEFIKSWGVSLLPEALLIDRKGILRKMHLEGELLVDALEELLDE